MQMAEDVKGLEERMQQQEEAHERESEERQAEARCVLYCVWIRFKGGERGWEGAPAQVVL